MNYSEIIQSLIQKQANLHKSGSVPVETIFDTERHHYLLIKLGWVNDRWFYSCLFHLDIINDKIYIQQNNTELEVASYLVDVGVPKHDIVIGFHSPFTRRLTEYSVG